MTFCWTTKLNIEEEMRGEGDDSKKRFLNESLIENCLKSTQMDKISKCWPLECLEIFKKITRSQGGGRGAVKKVTTLFLITNKLYQINPNWQTFELSTPRKSTHFLINLKLFLKRFTPISLPNLSHFKPLYTSISTPVIVLKVILEMISFPP